MSEYLNSILSVGVMTGFLALLVPENNGVSKYVRFAASLAVLCVIVAPLKNASGLIPAIDRLFTTVPDAGSYNANGYNEAILKAGLDNIKKEIGGILKQRYGVSADENEIEIEVNADDIEAVTIEKIIIDLRGHSMWKNAREIEAYIADLFSCECVVAVR